MVLATDLIQTVSVFIYGDIQWGDGAQIGFNIGDGYTSFIYPKAHVYIDENSNVGLPGVFIYRIDRKRAQHLDVHM